MRTPQPAAHVDILARDDDQFFKRHLTSVVARLETQTKKALERQRAAWRDSVRREALLQGKDFDLE